MMVCELCGCPLTVETTITFVTPRALACRPCAATVINLIDLCRRLADVGISATERMAEDLRHFPPR